MKKGFEWTPYFRCVDITIDSPRASEAVEGVGEGHGLRWCHISYLYIVRRQYIAYIVWLIVGRDYTASAISEDVVKTAILLTYRG